VLAVRLPCTMLMPSSWSRLLCHGLSFGSERELQQCHYDFAKWNNLNHAIMILLNWRYAILTHMSVTEWV
jgi:hypothetical protein